MDKKEFTIEHFLYLVAFLCALGIRLFGLGEMPLSESEASWAIQAHQVSQGEALIITGQPAYVLLTGFLFAIFKSTDAVARFLPALMGGMLILLPFALRDRLGKMAAVLFAFGLAFDPGMVAASRLAGGPMLAMGFGGMMIVAGLLNLPIFAGIMGALFLMSGPSFLTGAVGIILAGLLWASTRKEKITLPKQSLQQAGMAAGLTILVAGTLFMRYPQGLSATFNAIPDYFRGWVNPGGVYLIQVILALIAYQPLAVIFGGIALLRRKNWNTPIIQFLVFWFLIALGFTLAYPSRQVTDILWASLPLWGLAAYELAGYFRPIPREAQLVAWGQTTIITVFMIFFWLNLSSLSAMASPLIPPGWNILQFNQLDQLSRIYVLRIIVALVVPIFGAMSVLLVGSGWRLDEALRGTVYGTLIVFGLYTISASWGAGHIRERAANELWNPSPVAGLSNLLNQTVEELSEMNTGNRDAMEVVYQIESASLAWVLRDKPQARYASQLAVDELPPVIINAQLNLDDPNISAAYRGQSFSWWVHRYWNQSLPPDFDRWLIYREGPTFSEPVILWARTDLFPGDLLTPSEDADPVQAEPVKPFEEP